MDNLSQQLDELEALKSIFGDEWHVDTDTGTYHIDISKEVKMYITLTPEYPSEALPKYELLAPNLNIDQKRKIEQKFQNLYNTESGGPLIYQMIMIVEDIAKKNNSKSSSKSSSNSEVVVENMEKKKEPKQSLLKIHHGPTIVDRKSVFQGHVCEVHSKEDVNAFMEELLENRKIANATHNISAYRILLPNNVVLQDCDDDGENKASSRVLELLQTLKLNNVMVVITRWFGGIQLGPDRFRHINNAARQALVESGLIKS